MSMNVTMSQMMLRPPSNFAGILFIVSAKIELIPNYLLSLKKKVNKANESHERVQLAVPSAPQSAGAVSLQN